MRRKWLLIILIIILVLVITFYEYYKPKNEIKGENTPETRIVSENLEVPWSIGFLPNGEMLVTERIGNLLRIGESNKIIKVEGVQQVGEGGLLGLAIHPNFTNNNFIYIYFTSYVNGDISNNVERYKLNLELNILEDKNIILSGIPGSAVHNGGRIKFGPDGYLYITTGDASEADLAQNTSSLAGKILRMDENGNVPGDNPFENEIYSYGHRNVQGITWDDEGRLWATEHGRSGLLSGYDELNLIEKGKNYGWPIIEGEEKNERMESPVIHSGASLTWAPADAIFFEGSIYYTGLRGETIYEYNINEGTIKEYFKYEFGRLRAISLNNNSIYFSTSNTDGRGSKNLGDDKIIVWSF